MKSKKEIAAILKEAGVGFVKVSVDSWNDKVYKDWNGKSNKGVKGGSYGPMTMTNAHFNHDRETADELVKSIGSQYLVERYTNKLKFEIQISDKHKRELVFLLEHFPSNASSRNLDEGYKTKWWTLHTKDVKI